LKVQTFIAFAYTYHYLNWFSKTSIIQWHKVDKRKMYITLSLWVACCAMFYFNYRIGLAAIYVLSMLHIILEFPLNVASIKSLFQASSDPKPHNSRATQTKEISSNTKGPNRTFIKR
jgi:hypothetical protein